MIKFESKRRKENGCEKIRKLENHFWRSNIQLRKISGGENGQDSEKEICFFWYHKVV